MQVDADGLANLLNDDRRDLSATATFESAVDNYGLLLALQAIKDAKAASARVSGQGPFLLAWSPSSDKGKPNTIVLRADLSNVTTLQQAAEFFRQWRSDIELNPLLWTNGWDIEKLRTMLRLWADKYGPLLLASFKSD